MLKIARIVVAKIFYLLMGAKRDILIVDKHNRISYQLDPDSCDFFKIGDKTYCIGLLDKW